ncbi:MAG: helix-turn-helix transcriptional regulator [Pseudomonadota bacterium]
MASRDRSVLFRTRLHEAMGRQDLSKSALARKTGVDRSTIGQLLKDDMPRMPNAQLAADIAAALGLSADWLLGLTNHPQMSGDVLASALALSPAERSLADVQIKAWHHQAIGSKIRHVPATLPEMLKTPDFIAWEYAASPPALIEQIGETSRDMFDWMRAGESDYEIALPLHEVEACAAGTGYYAGLDQETRRKQLAFLAKQCEALFPRLRLFLFDGRHMHSAPMTVFGNAVAIIYVGKCYLSLLERQRVTALTEHFDWLVRGAAVDAREAATYFETLSP